MLAFTIIVSISKYRIQSYMGRYLQKCKSAGHLTHRRRSHRPTIIHPRNSAKSLLAHAWFTSSLTVPDDLRYNEVHGVTLDACW